MFLAGIITLDLYPPVNHDSVFGVEDSHCSGHFIFLVGSGYYAVYLVGESDQRYSVDRIAVTAQITAYDIGFYSGKDAGSTYSIGELDGTFGNMIGKAPQAINVSLFRPYMWEIRNPLMALTATESILLLFFTLFVILKCRGKLIRTLNDPTILFCLIFSLTFAFAVGVSTFNFGTLARYVPLFFSIYSCFNSGLFKQREKPPSVRSNSNDQPRFFSRQYQVYISIQIVQLTT